jgi:hypothetical protein
MITQESDLNNFDFYYTIKIKSINQVIHYQALNGLSLKAGETRTIILTIRFQDGHYYGNMSGLTGIQKTADFCYTTSCTVSNHLTSKSKKPRVCGGRRLMLENAADSVY